MQTSIIQHSNTLIYYIVSYLKLKLNLQQIYKMKKAICLIATVDALLFLLDTSRAYDCDPDLDIQ